MSCSNCGIGDKPLCFNCFLGRPFQRNVECSACHKLRSVVRYYLNAGWQCDSCKPEVRGKPS